MHENRGNLKLLEMKKIMEGAVKENRIVTECVTYVYYPKKTFKVDGTCFGLSHYNVEEIMDSTVNKYNKELRAKLNLQGRIPNGCWDKLQIGIRGFSILMLLLMPDGYVCTTCQYRWQR